MAQKAINTEALSTRREPAGSGPHSFSSARWPTSSQSVRVACPNKIRNGNISVLRFTSCHWFLYSSVVVRLNNIANKNYIAILFNLATTELYENHWDVMFYYISTLHLNIVPPGSVYARCYPIFPVLGPVLDIAAQSLTTSFADWEFKLIFKRRVRKMINDFYLALEKSQSGQWRDTMWNIFPQSRTTRWRQHPFVFFTSWFALCLSVLVDYVAAAGQVGSGYDGYDGRRWSTVVLYSVGVVIEYSPSSWPRSRKDSRRVWPQLTTLLRSHNDTVET